MRWRIPIAVVLSAFVAVSCQDVPTATEDSAADVPATLKNANGNNGAVRWIPDSECAVFDGDGNFVFVDCRNQIATYSKNGNALVVVQATGIENNTGKVVKWDAYDPPQIMIDFFGGPPTPCFVLGPDGGALFTDKWKAQVTPGGHASFICQFAKKWEHQWP